VAEVVVTIQNDLLFTHVPAHTGVQDAFALANTVMADGLVGIAELIRCRGILAVDFASLRTLLRKQAALCSFGVGRASGEGRVQAVIENLFESPLLGGREFVQGADVVVATLVGGPDLSIGDMNQCLQALQQQLNPSTRVITGANQDAAMSESIALTVLAVHYEGERPTADRRRQSQSATTKTPAPGSRSRDKGDTTRQFKLPFEEERLSVGIFGNVAPTMHNGENLDVPTFQRRGVQIEADAP
jgi:cell division protein FtsZ